MPTAARQVRATSLRHKACTSNWNLKSSVMFICPSHFTQKSPSSFSSLSAVPVTIRTGSSPALLCCSANNEWAVRTAPALHRCPCGPKPPPRENCSQSHRLRWRHDLWNTEVMTAFSAPVVSYRRASCLIHQSVPDFILLFCFVFTFIHQMALSQL